MKTLTTERLILRSFTMDDAADFYEYAKDPDTGIHAGWKPHESIEESRRILTSFLEADETWAICERSTQKVIGSIGLHPDSMRSLRPERCRMMGYVLSKAYWGQGLMTEAAREVQRFAFEEMGLSLLSIRHASYNRRSARVIEKLGFSYEGTLHQSGERFDGVILDTCLYAMTREEYEAQKGKTSKASHSTFCLGTSHLKD